MKLVAMTCRNCGAKLQFSEKADQILCENCGSEYLVSFDQGAVSLQTLAEGVRQISRSSQQATAELALARIRKEQEDIAKEAWDLSASAGTARNYEAMKAELDRWKDPFPGMAAEDPRRTRAFIKARLAEENARFFRDRYWIGKIEDLLTEVQPLVVRWSELKKEEDHYRSLLRGEQ